MLVSLKYLYYPSILLLRPQDAYVMLCPEHASEMLPYEMEEDETDQSDGEEEAGDEGEPVKAKHVAEKRKAKAESSRSVVVSLQTFCGSYLFG
jgi:hypothetical protein